MTRPLNHFKQNYSPLTCLWTQCAGRCSLYLMARSNSLDSSNNLGLEHIEKPPTMSCFGMMKSTLKKKNTKTAAKKDWDSKNSRPINDRKYKQNV